MCHGARYSTASRRGDTGSAGSCRGGEPTACAGARRTPRLRRGRRTVHTQVALPACAEVGVGAGSLRSAPRADEQRRLQAGRGEAGVRALWPRARRVHAQGLLQRVSWFASGKQTTGSGVSQSLPHRQWPHPPSGYFTQELGAMGRRRPPPPYGRGKKACQGSPRHERTGVGGAR